MWPDPAPDPAPIPASAGPAGVAGPWPAGARLHRVRVGGIGPAALRQQLIDAGVRFNAYAEQLFADPRFVTDPAPSTVEVLVTTVAGLGFPDGARFDAWSAAASARGLALCPLALAPHWRGQWTTQPEGADGQPATRHQAPPGSVTVACAPAAGATDPLDALDGFYLRVINGVPWLRGYRSDGSHHWAPADQLAFLCPGPAR